MTLHARPDGEPDLAHELERLSRASVMVLGDVTLERRVHGTFEASGLGERSSVEPLLLGLESAEPGAGAGIVRALAGLRVATAFICVLGDDLPGAQLTALIGAQPNVEPWLLVDGAKATTTETTYVDGDQVVLRTLRHDVRPMQPSLRERMLRIAGDAMTATSVTVLSDRGHGTLDDETIEQLLGGARQVGRRVIADLAGQANSIERFRGCDAVVRIAADGDPTVQAEQLRLAADLPAVLLVAPTGGLALADREGIVSLPTPPWSDPAADYARIVALYAAGIAVGRGSRAACHIASGATRPAMPS